MNFQEKNLGCKMHVSMAIGWLFENVEDGIILEDDCLPTPSFFAFCTYILKRYQTNEDVLHINGTDFLAPNEITDTSFDYRFSRCAHVWGWATWRRAWKKYDLRMSHIDSLAQSDSAQNMFLKKKHFDFWIKHCKHIGEKNIDTWDAQWQYSIMYANGLVISPNANFVENIGFGSDATHTSSKNTYMLPVNKIVEPIHNPDIISVDIKADENLMEKIYMRSLWERVSSKVKTSLFGKSHEITIK
jgi:hypothetical protein